MLSFNLDFSQVWDNANQIITGMFPVYMVPLGLLIGIGVLNMIVKAFKSIVGGHLG